MHRLIRLLPVLVLLLETPRAFAQSSDCVKDRDACVRLAIAEMFVFIDECGSVYPASRDQLQAALNNWSVLRLHIARLSEATDRAGKLQARLRAALGASFRAAPAEDQGVECSGRYALLQNPEPKLAADSVQLPEDVLNRYRP